MMNSLRYVLWALALASTLACGPGEEPDPAPVAEPSEYTPVAVPDTIVRTQFGSLQFNTTTVVDIHEDSDTALAMDSTAGSLTLSSRGEITDQSAATLTVTGGRVGYLSMIDPPGGSGATGNVGSCRRGVRTGRCVSRVRFSTPSRVA